MLDEIMAYHREKLPKDKRSVPLADLRALASVADPPLNFYEALKQPGVTLIAECKKASPSKGLMVPNYDPVALAGIYTRAGAGAISVLTDGRYFQGSLTHLRDVKEAVQVPVLRKDFIFDPYQLYESRAAGADAVLLIAAVLRGGELGDLLALTQELGMEALVEVHDARELERVLHLSPRVVGINNRNLQTFQVDFENTGRLRALIPAEIATIAESGIKNADDARQMAALGVDAMLVGQSLVKSKDPLAKAKELVQAAA
jgi:indole-3-glycerol phosphate synthase